MSTDSEKQLALIRAQSVALTNAGRAALAARSRADLRVGDEAAHWLQEGLEFNDQRKYEEAFECFERGIQLDPNHSDIELALGFAYQEGNGVVQDCAQAANWYRRAEKHGSSNAQQALQLLYEKRHWKDVGGGKRVDELTHEELSAALRFDGPTGLLNEGSFERDQEYSPAQFVGISELDAYKTFREKFGNALGLRLMRVIAEAARLAGLDACVLHEEVLLYRGSSKEVLIAGLEQIRATLRKWKFEAIGKNDQAFEVEGVGFFFGIGTDIGTAHSDRKQRQAEIEAAWGQLHGEFWGCYDVRLKQEPGK
ncbi:MAG: hypothetical protein WB679_10690 [Terracidiphilus sp.]